ncbi:MAG TPA: O-methyltransferase [Lentisphaeria bacterium]|nr:MAG: hypothetical protein A2X47_08220 [Lentisphaerae bacterium GWF2_38_69]HBM16387.1 O-methyltransferase [Lentisphaeria bacterium]
MNIDSTNKVPDYIRTFSFPVNPELSRILKEHSERRDVVPCIGEAVASFITWLIKFANAKNAIEFGTCLGYSTIVLAEAVKSNNGHLTAIESAKNHFNETALNLKKAGLSEHVTLIHGDALTEFIKFDGPFDFILQDSLKSIYPEMLEDCITKLKKGGIIVADDTLFLPLGIGHKHAPFMDEYNRKVFADKRLESFILPIGDGLTVSFKKY